MIRHDSFSFLELSSASRKVAIVGSAFEVTPEFSLERWHIQGNSGETFYSADEVPTWQLRILTGYGRGPIGELCK